jgi:hypothetical protein
VAPHRLRHRRKVPTPPRGPSWGPLSSCRWPPRSCSQAVLSELRPVAVSADRHDQSVHDRLSLNSRVPGVRNCRASETAAATPSLPGAGTSAARSLAAPSFGPVISRQTARSLKSADTSLCGPIVRRPVMVVQFLLPSSTVPIPIAVTRKRRSPPQLVLGDVRAIATQICVVGQLAPRIVCSSEPIPRNPPKDITA